MIARRVHYGYKVDDLVPIAAVAFMMMMLSFFLLNGAMVTIATVFYIGVEVCCAIGAVLMKEQ